MFDFGKFTNWITGGLMDSHPTWEAYKASATDWQTTARQFTAPLAVIWALGVLVLGSLFGTGGGFGDFLISILWSIFWFGLGSFITCFLAKKFGGTDSFDQALAALTFASIPGIIGAIGGTLPFIGLLFSIGGAIWSIMLLWQALPVFLDIPLEKRTGHFFATLALSIPASLLTFGVLMAMGLSNATGGADSDFDRFEKLSSERRERDGALSTASNRRDATDPSDRESDRKSGRNYSDNNDDSGAGLFGFGREMDYIAAAEEDEYAPPKDGLLDEEQVERATKYFAAADRLRNASTEAFEKLDNKGDQKPSLGDLFKGVKGLVSAGTAEMQAVKSGGGNWAEHEWIKRQLFEARLHEDLNDKTAHNFELYQKYEEQLKDWL